MSEPLVHLCWDLETLGKREHSVVLSLGCVPFTLEKHEYFSEYIQKGFYIKFSIEEQMKVFNRTYSQDTIRWWKGQGKEARKLAIEPSSSDVGLKEGINKLCKWIGTTGYSYKNSYSFSRASNFDFHILEHLIEESAQTTLPFNTWKIRDSLTYIDIFAGNNSGKYDLQLGNKSEGFIHHYALHDAALEAARLNELYYMMQNQDIPF